MKRLPLLAGVLISGLIVAPSVLAFADVPPAYESRRAIEYLQREGVLEGYADGLFRPAFHINRAELLKVLVAAKGIKPSPDLFGNCFPDVTDQWYAPYVCYAQREGWVQGYPDGSFGPELPVTFAETLKMLVEVRGYPLAPPDESQKRGIDPNAWFAPYLTSSLLIDIVSYGQVWGTAALPLQAAVNRGFVAELLYRALLAEGSVHSPLVVTECDAAPAALDIKTYVDVVLPSHTNVFRQELRGVDPLGGTCVLAADANPFGRVTGAFDPYFLQPYPSGQPADSWNVRVPLIEGKAVLRGATINGAFRPEVFVADVVAGEVRQLPSIFASAGGSLESADHRFIVYVGSAGRTIEAIDLRGGTHVIIDAVLAPLTFAPPGGQPLALSSGSPTVVTYPLYDETVTTASGALLLEVRTADVNAMFAPPPAAPDETPEPTPVFP